MIYSVIPRTATPDGTLLMFPEREPYGSLVANLGSFVLDYVVRQISGASQIFYGQAIGCFAAKCLRCSSALGLSGDA
jgi:hypothetical protein